MTLVEQRQLGRAKNAVLGYLERKLVIPKIYLDAPWAGHSVDVLAIDRDGSGDVSVALLFPRPYFPNGKPDTLQEAEIMASLLTNLETIPGQYKYIVAVEAGETGSGARFTIPEGLLELSFAKDGVGRTGWLLVDSVMDGESQTRLLMKPERFRARIAQLADDFIIHHAADWELRAEL